MISQKEDSAVETETSRKCIWGTIVVVAVVLIIFAIVVDINDLLNILKRLDLKLFLVGVLFLLGGIVLISIRWRLLLSNEPSSAPTFHANSISYMLKLFLPIPQAMTRLTTLSSTSSISIYQSAPMMMIERFMEMIMRLVALTLTIVLLLEVPLWIVGLVIAAVLLLGVPTFLLWFTRNASTTVPRLVERSIQIPGLNKERLVEALVEIQENVSTMSAARGLTTSVLYSLGMWGLFLLFYTFGFLSPGLRLDSRKIFVMSAMVLAVLPPSTPAMIGVYQGLIVAILLPFGLFDVNTATAYGILVFGAQLLVWMVLGIWGLKRTDIKIRKLSKMSMDDHETIISS